MKASHYELHSCVLWWQWVMVVWGEGEWGSRALVVLALVVALVTAGRWGGETASGGRV